MDRIRILIVDDQKLFADNLKTVLEGHSNSVRVVSVAYNGKEAIKLVKNNKIDVVLMDIRMPVMDGIEATRVLKETHPDVKVVVLSTYDEDELITRALHHGAVGYLLKNISSEEIIDAVKLAHKGSFLTSPSVGKKIVKQLDEAYEQNKSRAAEINRLISIFQTLSRREGEVLDLLLRAFSNREIAEMLFVSEQTVKNHLSAIYKKLGVKDRMHALTLANKLIQENTADNST